MAEELITSLQNPKVKLARALWDRRAREKSALFLIEGYRELSFALRSRFAIEMIFFCPELFLGTNETKLLREHKERGAELFMLPKALFEKLSYRDRPDGLIAIAHKAKCALDDLPLSNPPFLVLAESIEKPGNLGTLLRSSDAVGVDGVIVADRTTDIFNPNVVRSSVGALFTVPVCEEESRVVLEWLRARKIAIVAAMPEASVPFYEIDYRQPIALALGSEQYGLSALLESEADYKVRIPMGGRCDSLNVASAATLLLYEVYRQRKGAST